MNDYNKILEELENCLGLEGVEPQRPKQSKPIKRKKAFEGYDDVEAEIAASLESDEDEISKDEDFVFDDEAFGLEDPENPTSEEGEEESDEDLIVTTLKSYLSSLLENLSPEEAKGKIGDLVGKAIEEVIPDGDSGKTEDPSPENETEESAEEASATEAPLGKAVTGGLVDKLLALGGASRLSSTESEESKADEGTEKGGEEAFEGDEEIDPRCPGRNEASFEAFCSKMISRYSELAGKKPAKKESATEGEAGEKEVKINEKAMTRVAVEFGYNTRNLRPILTDAIKKGVI